MLIIMTAVSLIRGLNWKGISSIVKNNPEVNYFYEGKINGL
jgi:hypothetical protein